MSESFRIFPIGRVVRPPAEASPATAARGDSKQTNVDGTTHADWLPAEVRVAEEQRAGLYELGRFSHILVLWWADRRDRPDDRARLRVHPRPAPEHLMGVFATRSPARPNPVAVSVCRLLSVDEGAGVLKVAGIDAEDGTPVVDIKPYIPGSDRVREARLPPWFSHLPDAFEERERDADGRSSARDDR